LPQRLAGTKRHDRINPYHDSVSRSPALGINQEGGLPVPDQSRPTPLTTATLTALCGRLTDHADRIENIVARPLVDDLLLASRAIEYLLTGIQAAIDSTDDPRDHLRKLVGGR
jgi:hypothetical protein